MDVDELLALDRPLTDEEFAFLEQKLLETVREFHALVEEMLPQVAPQEPFLAERLRNAADSILANVEEAAAL
jgi:hypothetical protein